MIGDTLRDGSARTWISTTTRITHKSGALTRTSVPFLLQELLEKGSAAGTPQRRLARAPPHAAWLHRYADLTKAES